MPLLDTPEMAQFLALARVKTPAGSDKYDQNIGEEIKTDQVKKPPSRPVTPTRLRSMRRQIDAAESAGNDVLADRLRKEFRAAFRSYARTYSMAQAALASQPGEEGKP